MKSLAKTASWPKVHAIVLVVTFIVSLFVLNFKVLAQTTPPDFPSCESKIFTANGDKAHYTSGVHGIVGVGNLSGRDDVYTLSNRNYLQCFCPADGSTGIQSNWWDVQFAGLSRTEIDSYKTQGWMEQNGSGWNLYNETYLIKNRNFSCTQPAPSVTPTAVPVPTVTSVPGKESKCFDLEAQPSEGTAPLTVKFIGHADDPNSNGKIAQYRFDFADASGGQPQVWFQSGETAYHRYELSGEYEAKLRIQDNAGNWRESDDCKVKVKVAAAPQVLGASTTSVLPSTGLSSAVALLILPLGLLGYLLYRRFRLA